MTDDLRNYTIGTLARTAGVNIETIRFYQRKKLMRIPERPHGGIRHYGQQDLKRLKFVKSAQRLGFNLEEVAQLLHLDDGAHCKQAAAVAESHLSDVRKRLEQLKAMEAALAELLEECQKHSGEVACPLISALQS
ncbi:MULTISPECIES: Hg(II)-responsive transcriptional regulator [Acidithiobacillus]|jgi:MerR family mercuric resistance operon transcriptional regulator|uniref:Mercuric resistance operon regulatory protein n=2 Tax=Acidithiobacillus TaxID=119977 RepID=A0A5P9XTX7_ACITH|nr:MULTISPECIES: Hg(II)-responsive transcriptional regulator [Acidithiobacillus]MBE7567956.1 Hg(II)-responsive transcriptional regulator [Acidithiobacillus sp. HP-11]MBU2741056.1 Hg(II)-responsive transcriptional regulator [Acidithiobacillus albertensis]MBU2749121.1 Hg(II)-responsive transcriptional regulator [Acidithiobacillus montserratensis]MBU2751403.1 Hg(II)-responsive transcriptional regulator [Acidithiobacillus thiooxidans]MBU2793079.1 Hg(II)-responsive transcriptional regulator [Acidit